MVSVSGLAARLVQRRYATSHTNVKGLRVYRSPKDRNLTITENEHTKTNVIIMDDREELPESQRINPLTQTAEKRHAAFLMNEHVPFIDHASLTLDQWRMFDLPKKTENMGVFHHIFKTSMLSPFQPEFPLTIKGANDTEMLRGNVVDPMDFQSAPQIAFESANPDALYTFVLVGLDCVIGEENDLKLQWMVSNIRGSASNLSQASENFAFEALAPFEGTGFNRYAGFVFEQAGRLPESKIHQKVVSLEYIAKNFSLSPRALAFCQMKHSPLLPKQATATKLPSGKTTSLKFTTSEPTDQNILPRTEFNFNF